MRIIIEIPADGDTASVTTSQEGAQQQPTAAATQPGPPAIDAGPAPQLPQEGTSTGSATGAHQPPPAASSHGDSAGPAPANLPS